MKHRIIGHCLLWAISGAMIWKAYVEKPHFKSLDISDIHVEQNPTPNIMRYIGRMEGFELGAKLAWATTFANRETSSSKVSEIIKASRSIPDSMFSEWIRKSRE